MTPSPTVLLFHGMTIDHFLWGLEENNLMTLAVLCMVQDDQHCIKLTLESLRTYVSTIILHDTGMTQETMDIVEQTCRENDQTVHLSQGVFTTFSESLNEALTFAETVPADFLLILYPGEEFYSGFDTTTLCRFLERAGADCFMVQKEWLSRGRVSCEESVRILRNHKGLRYDTRVPLYEVLEGQHTTVDMKTIVSLYQNRDWCGDYRERNLQLLLDAEPTQRNYYSLVQSYMSLHDYTNALYYGDLCEKQPAVTAWDTVDDYLLSLRMASCAMMCTTDTSVILRYLERAMELQRTRAEPLVSLFQYAISSGNPMMAVPYLERAFMVKGRDLYRMWHLLSIVCLMTGHRVELGYMAISNIIDLQKPLDVENHKIYQQIFEPNSMR